MIIHWASCDTFQPFHNQSAVTKVGFKITYFCFSCPFYLLDKGWSSWLKQVLRGLVTLLWGLTIQQTDSVYCTSDMHLSLIEKVDKMGGARQVFYLNMAAGTISEAYNQEKGVSRHYWVIQAGLLTPLTFAQHRLSPLAAFTSGAYFLHNGRQ